MFVVTRTEGIVKKKKKKKNPPRGFGKLESEAQRYQFRAY
jgi:hypothetical protein